MNNEEKEVIMANEQNLKVIRDSKRARELQEKSVAKRKENIAKANTFKAVLEILLNDTYTDKKGVKRTGWEVASLKVFENAMKGDRKSFETIRDTIGQKPVDKVMIAEVEQSVIDEVERMVLGDDEETSD